MNTLTYKGYIGSVNFSEEDNMFLGKIERINALVNFKGESVKELTKAFHKAVDNYLKFCKEEGITPQKPYSGSFKVRITPEAHGKLALLAKKSGVSLNTYIKQILERQIAMMQ